MADDQAADRVAAIDELAADPVLLSTKEDGELDALEASLLEELPSLESAALTLPLRDDAMSVVSWLHDEAAAVEVAYGPESAMVTLEAGPAVVAKARSRVQEL